LCPRRGRSVSLSDSIRYHILKQIQENPHSTQRELAKSAGISLGKTNYCLRSFIEKGLIKANNFKKSSNKSSYSYILTPKGIEEKAKVTYRFLKQKMAEYESLKQEIEELQKEAQIPDE